jgi:hypothetical protein
MTTGMMWVWMRLEGWAMTCGEREAQRRVGALVWGAEGEDRGRWT